MKNRWNFKENTLFFCIFLFIGLLVSIILCISIGPVNIAFQTVWRVMFYKIIGIGDITDIPANTQNIIWFLRAPRVLLGAMIGICLTLSGVGMQAFTKNPLAEPYILGISSGASCFAVIAIAIPTITALSKYATSVGAFTGAMLAISLVYYLSKTGRDVTPMRLILVGVAISAMFNSFTNYLIYAVPDNAKVREVTFWMLGGLASTKWEYLIAPAIILPIAVTVMFAMSNSLNALMMGEATAVTLGINVNVVRKLIIVLTALMTAVAVAVSGSIGFVGLVIPHIIRGFTGADHRKVIPVSVLGGAIFLIWIDVGARMLNAPSEIPIGILTSIIGAPFFLWMVKVKKYSFGKKS